MCRFSETKCSKIPDLEERAGLFEEAMEPIWEWESFDDGYLSDYAHVAAFLSHTTRFEEVFKLVDEDLEKSFWSDYRAHSNWFTTTCRTLFTQYNAGNNFAGGANLVMVGSAYLVFGTIVRSGYLFKDGTGPGHGEYTHTLQWLTVARAAHEKRLNLTHTVYDLYVKSAGGRHPLTLKLLTREGGRKSGDLQAGQQVPIWSYLVDCFPDPSGEANLRENVLSESYRTPSFFMRQLCSGSLYYTFVSIWLEIRREERPWGNTRRKDLMRSYHIDKQSRKGRKVLLKEGFNTFVSDDAKGSLQKKLLKL